MFRMSIKRGVKVWGLIPHSPHYLCCFYRIVLFGGYEVLGATHGATTDEAVGVGEDAPERCCVASGEGRACMFLHDGEDSRGRHELPLVLAGGNGEALLEVELLRR